MIDMHSFAQSSRLLWPLALFLFLGMTSPASAKRPHVPSGTLVPRKGPFKGKPCRYGGGADEYARLAEFSSADLIAYLSGKKKPIPPEVKDFLYAHQQQQVLYGSQLSKDGLASYVELVRACLENGEFDPGNLACRYRASFVVGLDILTGKPVKEYMLLVQVGWWILEPGWRP